MERLLAGHEPPLTLAQHAALRAIERDSPSAGELARRTGVSGPAVSQLIAALEAVGFVERVAAAGDRRRRELSLTRSGRRVLRSAERLLRGRVERLLVDLPRPETDALARGLPDVEALLAGEAPPRRTAPPPPPRPRAPRR
jgi:DNA-binding MarR family transcriptional regulator